MHSLICETLLVIVEDTLNAATVFLPEKEELAGATVGKKVGSLSRVTAANTLSRDEQPS
jgi:hypothetical protein